MPPVHGINSRSGRNHWPEYESPAPLVGAAACVESTSKQLILLEFQENPRIADIQYLVSLFGPPFLW